MNYLTKTMTMTMAAALVAAAAQASGPGVFALDDAQRGSGTMVILANDGSIGGGQFIARNAAAALNRALKAQAAGGDGGHDHAGHDH